MKPAIELHIDQLVLDGFTRKESSIISHSMQSELHHLIENGHLENSFTQDSHQRNMHVNSITTQENMKPELVGQQIAQSIFYGLSTNNTDNN